MSDEAVRYVVRQFNWLAAGGGLFARAPGDRRVAWFDAPSDADRDAAERVARVRAKYNPFAFGTVLHQLTTFPPAVFRDWLLDADVTPPADAGADATGWRAWWAAADLPPAGRARVWDGLNRVRFYDVIARRPSETAYAVVRILWDYDDSFYYAAHEGGATVAVYRRRERAEEERERLEEAVKADPNAGRVPDLEYRPYCPNQGYFLRDPERFLEAGEETWEMYRDGVPQYEVVEIDYRGLGE